MPRKVTRRISRRLFGKGVVAVAGCAAVSTGAAHSASAAQTMTLSGHVRWFNRSRGLVMFRPDRPDASDILIHLQLQRPWVNADDMKLRKLIRPLAAMTVTFTWRPDIDVLAPWHPNSLVSAGEMLACRGQLPQESLPM